MLKRKRACVLLVLAVHLPNGGSGHAAIVFDVCFGLPQRRTCFPDTEIGGWSVSAKPDASGTCLAARSYNDKDDDNKKNSVVFGLVKNNAATQMVMVLGYEGWNFDKGEAVVGDLIIDGKTIYKDWKWEGDGKVLTAVFDDTMIPVLGAGKKIVLRFGKDEEANFLIPNAGLALGAVQLCMG